MEERIKGTGYYTGSVIKKEKPNLIGLLASFLIVLAVTALPSFATISLINNSIVNVVLVPIFILSAWFIVVNKIDEKITWFSKGGGSLGFAVGAAIIVFAFLNMQLGAADDFEDPLTFQPAGQTQSPIVKKSDDKNKTKPKKQTVPPKISKDQKKQLEEFRKRMKEMTGGKGTVPSGTPGAQPKN